MNVLSPEMIHIVEVDVFHWTEDNNAVSKKKKGERAVSLPGSEAVAWYKMVNV